MGEKKDKEVYEKIIKYSEEYYQGKLHQERYLLLYGAISLDVAYMINTQLLVMAKEEPDKPITIEINSPGGSVVDGLSIIDTMNHIKPEVITIVNGLAASMGAIISCSGDKRYAYPNSQIMLHSASGMVGDYVTHMKDSITWLEKISNRLKNILKEKSILTEKEYFKMDNGELWLNSKESKKFKLIDKII